MSETWLSQKSPKKRVSDQKKSERTFLDNGAMMDVRTLNAVTPTKNNQRTAF
jgi:hypothetical protein